MRYWGEVRSENFLEREGFNIVPRRFVSRERDLLAAMRSIRGEFVMKVAGARIVHKNKIGGIRLNAKTYSQSLKYFRELKKIKGAQGVLIQAKGAGVEVYVGIKKTPEFGEVVGVGAGGTLVEERGDVSFRVVPITKSDALEMIGETKFSQRLGKNDVRALVQVLMKLSRLAQIYSNIFELDINPMFVKNGIYEVVDARIVWE